MGAKLSWRVKRGEHPWLSVEHLSSKVEIFMPYPNDEGLKTAVAVTLMELFCRLYRMDARGEYKMGADDFNLIHPDLTSELTKLVANGGSRVLDNMDDGIFIEGKAVQDGDADRSSGEVNTG